MHEMEAVKGRENIGTNDLRSRLFSNQKKIPGETIPHKNEALPNCWGTGSQKSISTNSENQANGRI